MKIFRNVIILSLPISWMASAAPLTPSWEVTENISSPESAYYDADTKKLYVSNIDGEGTAKDGSGWISLLEPNGRVVEAKWVSGLNAPKGMRSHGGTLWVSDIDTLVGIDIATKKITTRVAIEGAKFLNDVAVSNDGRVFVSDTLGSAIYEYSNGKVSVFASGDQLESPNGLLVVGDKLWVGAWGKTTDFSTKVPGRLYSMDLKSKKKAFVTKKPFANLDGLEQPDSSRFLVSDWVAGKVFEVDLKGKAKLLVEGLAGAADLAYIPESKLIVVPRMKENKVTAYPWSTETKL